MEGLRGALTGSTGIIYGKAAIAGVESGENESVSAGDESIAISFGYPDATSAAVGLTVSMDGFVVLANGSAVEDTIDFGFLGYTENCVRYTQATGASSVSRATVTIISGVDKTACGLDL